MKVEARMKVEDIKDKIRTLTGGEMVELFRWLDRQLASSDTSGARIGIRRSLDLRQELDERLRSPALTKPKETALTSGSAQRPEICHPATPSAKLLVSN